MASMSAGILMFRHTDDGILVLLVHPGGPFWRNRDLGAWSIPKGEYQEGEDPQSAARREFAEELGVDPKGPLRPRHLHSRDRSRGMVRASRSAQENSRQPGTVSRSAGKHVTRHCSVTRSARLAKRQIYALPAYQGVLAVHERRDTVKGKPRRSAPHRHVAMLNAKAVWFVAALQSAEQEDR